MSNFGYFTGKIFLELELSPREWLVENIIRKGDSVIFVGNEKSGKSLFIFQLICALTSGQPFLNTYSITKPCRVAYFQLEGELSDSQDRLKRMLNTLDCNLDLIDYYFYPPIELQNHEYAVGLTKVIEANGKPDILIIDPIYFSFTGSLNHDEIVRKFIGEIRILKDKLGCAVILVHHTHKKRFTVDGYDIDEGDDVLFGSKFLKAWADHILMFMYDTKKALRTMTCTTQRSGDIVQKCEVRLIEPNPLYFETLDKKVTSEALVMNLLYSGYKNGLPAEEIMKHLDISKNNFYESIKSLLHQKVIVKSHTRPVIYIYNWEKFNENSSNIGI